MGRPTGSLNNPFARVGIARNLLREKAEELYKKYMDIIQKAEDAGQYEVAAKHLQWLIDHMPAEDDGTRMIDQSVDKKQEVIDRGPVGPAIQIGIQVGGTGNKHIEVSKPKELPKPIPAEIIDAE